MDLARSKFPQLNEKWFCMQRDNLIEEVTTPVPRLLDEVIAAEETATSVSAPSSPGTNWLCESQLTFQL